MVRNLLPTHARGGENGWGFKIFRGVGLTVEGSTNDMVHWAKVFPAFFDCQGGGDNALLSCSLLMATVFGDYLVVRILSTCVSVNFIY